MCEWDSLRPVRFFLIISILAVAPVRVRAQSAPTVTTSPATNDNGAQITLEGTVAPNGSATCAWFQYGTTLSYGLTTPATYINGTNAGAVPVSELVNVSYNSTYHFQLVASNASGTSYGADQMFTTPAAPTFGPVTVLHNFNGYTGDNYGALPYSSLIESNGVFYGTTSAGGPWENGVVFRMNKDGSGFAVLHAFAGNLDNEMDGSSPFAAVTLCGNTLYGVTFVGGADGIGTVFSIHTDGTGYAKLHDFTGTNDGANPSTPLVVSGNVLYGAALTGGTNGTGTIFSLRTDGTYFSNVYTFTAPDPVALTNGDGVNPNGALVLSGNTLFGAATLGGLNDAGTVFEVNTDGSGFSTLYNFDYTDGFQPIGGVTLSGTTLYGTTIEGGDYFEGNVFSIDTNSLTFASLYSFTGGGDGAAPQAGVTISNGFLYGTTAIGGNNDSGGVYAVSTDGSVFDPIYSFSAFDTDFPTNSDGILPLATPLLCGTNLYGTASGGGPNAIGTIFQVDLNGDFTTLFGFQAPTNNSDGSGPGGALALSGTTLYSTTQFGGVWDDGTVFKVGTDGSGFETLHDFTLTDPVFYTNGDGAEPVAGPILCGGELYGTAAVGGIGASGTIYSIDTNGDTFNVLYSFSPTDENGFNNDGQQPDGGLIMSANTLYGTTALGGQGGTGTIYAFSLNGSVLNPLYSFTALDTTVSPPTNGDGANCNTRLLLSGSTLYGTAYGGGIYGAGTIFSIGTARTNFTVLYTFTGGADGGAPQGGLVISGNTLYGTASSGGVNNNGTIYKINTDGSSFTPLYSFSTINPDGAAPLCDLCLSGNVLYGTASEGGVDGAGTIFQLNTDGSGYMTLLNFDYGVLGGIPEAGLLLSGGYLYGTSSAGDQFDDGNVFSLNLREIPTYLNIQAAGPNIVLTWDNSYMGLQGAINVNGPYTNISGATSPYTTNAAGAQQFFRLHPLPQ